MLSEPTPEGNHSAPTEKSITVRIRPDQFTLSALARSELNEKRGLTDSTIEAARLGSIRVQEDLDALGLDWDIDTLPSLHVIRYFDTANEDGTVIYRLHKRSLPGLTYPPYRAPVFNEAGPVVIAESELKAIAAAQLGCRAYGMQGIDSFVGRIPELVAAVQQLTPDIVYIVLDREREIVEDPDLLAGGDTLRAAHTYALSLETAGIQAHVVDLPDKYLIEATHKDGGKYLKADIDGALAAGMTAEEFRACLDESLGFFDYAAAIEVKVHAIWRHFKDNAFDQQEIWNRLLDGKTILEKKGAMYELCRRVRTIAFDAESKSYDPVVVDALAARIKKLFQPILGTVGIASIKVTIRRPSQPAEIQLKDLALASFGLAESEGKVLYVRQGRFSQVELVANFTVSTIRSGVGGFVGSHQVPLHQIDIKCATGDLSTIEVHGSLFDAQSYKDASSGRLTVSDGGRFKAYLTHKLERDGIQIEDPTIDRTFMVGARMNRDGKLEPNDSVRFRQQREECWYHGHVFADGGSKRTFYRVARLQRNESITLLLVWALGTLLKPALRWAYPHCLTIADSGIGKDTISEILHQLFGWLTIAGPPEFERAYRSKKAVANSILPIQVQEVGRLDYKGRKYFTEMANLSYNCQPTTHGHLDKTFVLCAPLLVWGQDFGIADIALSAKTIRVSPTAQDKDEQALSRLRRHMIQWPMRDWAVFLCDWANRRDLQAEVEVKVKLIRMRIGHIPVKSTSNSDRSVWNYAVLLVVADALRAFGVPVRIDDAVCSAAMDHLTTTDTNSITVARQVVRDLLLELQKTEGRGSFIADLTAEGLYFKPENTLKELRSRNYQYDISDPNTLIRMLDNEGLGHKSKLHSIGQGPRTRFFLIPPSILKEFDFAVGEEGTHHETPPLDEL